MSVAERVNGVHRRVFLSAAGRSEALTADRSALRLLLITFERFSLSDLSGDLSRFFGIAFGVNLRYVGFGVPQNHLSPFESELFSDRGCRRVAKLVWAPSLRRLVGFQLAKLGVRQSPPSRSFGLSRALS